MPRISQLPSLTAAANSDEIAIVDVSSSTTKKITRGDLLKAPLPANSVNTAAIADGAVTAPKIDYQTQTTDANGWRVAIVGGARVYFKRLTYTVSVTAGSAYVIPLSSNNLPVGMTTIGHRVLQMSLMQAQTAFSLQPNFEMDPSSTVLNITCYSYTSGSQSGAILVTIYE